MSGRSLPKFGDWDVNDPATGEGFTVIFNKARDEKKTSAEGGANPAENSAGKDEHGKGEFQHKQRKWLCCLHPSAVG